MIVDIKEISGNIRFSTPINEGCKRKFMLMKEDYITLKFSVSEPVHFKLGDGIDNELGIFELVDLNKPTYNENTGGYDYELRLDAYYWKWKNKKFKFTPETGGQEASWNLTAPLDVQLGVFIRNLNALGYKFRESAFDFSIDSTVENASKPMAYSNISLIDALSQMAEAWECEWWIENNYIHFGRCEYNEVSPVDFELGKNVESMTRSDSQSGFATRVYAFGSIRNIPTNYRSVDESVVVNGIVQKRLMLPVGIPYIDAYPDMSTEEAVEDVVVFEDVYPRRIGTVSNVTTHEYTDKIEEEGQPTKYEKWNAYRFKDSGITFSEDYRLSGADLKLIFQSGSLNGMKFDVLFNPDKLPERNSDGSWNPDAQVFEIVRNEDYGRSLPDEVLRPWDEHLEGSILVPADTYILSGFDPKLVSETMIPSAELELKEKAEKYIEKSKIDPSTYNCKMMFDGVLNADGTLRLFEAGERVNLINEAFFDTGNRQSRIIGFEYNLDIPYDSPIYTIGEKASYSRLGDIEDKIDSLTYKGQTYTGSGGSGVYIISLNDKTLPSDRNVFSAKRTLNEFVSKKNDDTIAGLLTLLKGLISQGNIEVGEFIDSLTSGAGIGLFPSGKIQASSVEIRDSLTVLELIFNRLSAQESDTAFSESGVIESIEVLEDGTYRLPLRKRWDTDFTAFDWNDIIYGSVNDLATGGGNYRTSWMRVIGINTVENYIEAVLYPHDEVPGGKNYPPEPLMAITRRGNTSDEDRQSYWYISSYEKCICMLDGVTKPILEEKNYSILIGRMKRLSLFDNLPINYRQSYVYCRGLIRQDDIRIDVTGKPIYEFVNRGIWSLSVATSEEPYLFESKNPVTGINETSTVYHRGTKWQCLKSRTLLEPKWNSTDWAFLEGNGEFSIDFESSKGFSFFYGLIDTVIEAKFFHGTADITDDVMNVPGTLITWSRDTGIEAEDNAWSPSFVDNQKNKIHLIVSDMGSQWLNARSVTFKVTAVIPLGEENYLRESEELQFNL